MEIDGSDYTFALLTGSPTLSYGFTYDCNGVASKNPCPHFGSATINTRGTGLILDPTVRSQINLYIN